MSMNDMDVMKAVTYNLLLCVIGRATHLVSIKGLDIFSTWWGIIIDQKRYDRWVFIRIKL
jgi:hypothetical protein